MANLPCGAFELLFVPGAAVTDGYLLIQGGGVEVVHNGKAARLEYSIGSVAEYLSDRNLLITGKAVTLTEPERPLAAEGG